MIHRANSSLVIRFEKQNIYNDIKSKPLLPSPHLIRAWQEVDVASGSNSDPAAGSGRPSMRSRHSSFLGLANSMILEEPFKRVRRWWKSAREELGDRNQGRMSPPMSPPATVLEGDGEQDFSIPSDDLERPMLLSSSSGSHLEDSPRLDSTPVCTPPLSMTSRLPPGSNSSTLSQGVPSPPRSFRSRFGMASDVDLNKSVAENSSRVEYVPSPILTRGYTTVSHEWRPEGDGLDHLVCFPKSKKASSLGSQYVILQCSDLMLEEDAEDS